MTTRIGLVSDTHFPVRCSELPDALFEALNGVDLILHAGDVGELSVLDQLSALAPVIGVYGNDESEDARNTLPYKTLVTVNGAWIFMWHSHYEDREKEFASRQEDAFLPKLQRTVNEAKSVGASVAVFGHWHIPLVREVDGITLINPGAVASGNEITRQLVQTIAMLEISATGDYRVRHIDLSKPMEFYQPQIAWEAGFAATLKRFSASILTPDLLSHIHSVLGQINAEEQETLRPLVLQMARQCWDGNIDLIDVKMFRSALAAESSLDAADRQRYLELLQ